MPIPYTNRHTCLIYDGSPFSHMKYIISLLILQLKMRKRCMFLGSPAAVSGAFSALKEAGIDVVEEMKKGSIVLSYDRAYLKKGVFEPAIMLESLSKSVDQALKDGYNGLWATGDIQWEFGAKRNLMKLLDYERQLDHMFQEKPELEGLCQYPKHTLPSHVLAHALLTHPGVFVNETLYGVNMFYTEPERLLKSVPIKKTRADVTRMLEQLCAA